MAPESIDKQPIPEWVKFYFTESQLTLPPSLLWVLLLYQRTGWEPSHVNVAQRLYVATSFKRKGEDKKDWHSEGSIARDLNLSRKTVGSAVKDLVAEGWMVKVPRPGWSSELWPAWPLEDCLTPVDGPELCAMRKKGGTLCTRRAGWGTDTPGDGPCKYHREAGPAQPLRTSEKAETVPREPGTCATIAHPDAQPLRTALRNGCARVPKDEFLREISSSSSPYVGEVEVADVVPARYDDGDIHRETNPTPLAEVRHEWAIRHVLERPLSLTTEQARAAVEQIARDARNRGNPVGSWKHYLPQFTDEQIRDAYRRASGPKAVTERCSAHKIEQPCRSCAADLKAAQAPEPIHRQLTVVHGGKTDPDAQAAINAQGREAVRAALADAKARREAATKADDNASTS
ncbi:hypothetical protein [Microbispora triticiradicis]|uniref:hypothetical protein n=1 Tax=Microbispora triticiradicis TaxID=2200763 RepID=UPI001AD61C83|nr:hypothetical protein [Microbispora triticiradicis]MBO4273761.1 hypothetical protein [Microbispora triticiradicis]